jgi:hypothetical protein
MKGDSSVGVIVPIVEGDGEVDAVPNLLYKLLHRHDCFDFHVARPKNAHGRGNLTAPGGVERFVLLALLEPHCEGVLVLLDADEDCAYTLANGLARRIAALTPQKPVVIIAAKCEYESWFLASLPTIAGILLEGRPGLKTELTYPDDRIEFLVGVKGWLSRNFQSGRIYKETLDQLPMTRLIDLNLALPKSRSLRRLEHAVVQLMESRNTAGLISPI